MSAPRLSRLAREALSWLASAGEMKRGRGNNFVWGVIDGRTATTLERAGYAERRFQDLGYLSRG